MSEPFLGEIRMFAGTFAPRGWALCDGQLLAIPQNDALFSLLGTTYGGDGRTTFALPELRGRLPVHAGTGPGLSPIQQGSRQGTETVALNATNIPAHTHALAATPQAGAEGTPVDGQLAQSTVGVYARSPNVQSLTSLDASTIAPVGGGQAHSNLQPFLCVNYIIALVGVYPSRT